MSSHPFLTIACHVVGQATARAMLMVEMASYPGLSRTEVLIVHSFALSQTGVNSCLLSSVSSSCTYLKTDAGGQVTFCDLSESSVRSFRLQDDS